MSTRTHPVHIIERREDDGSWRAIAELHDFTEAMAQRELAERQTRSPRPLRMTRPSAPAKES